MSQRIGICSLAVAMIMALPATAQEVANQSTSSEQFDGWSTLEALPTHLARRLADEQKLLEQVGIGGDDGASKGLIYGFNIWNWQLPAVKVCFLSGSRKTRARIAKIANEWKEAAPGVPLDFGDLEKPPKCKPGEVYHVRVGFNNKRAPGYWSLPGMASYIHADQGEQSMNLEGFDDDPPPPNQFRKTVLHEFGHALGLAHEHQSPLSKCEQEFDWEEIYKRMAEPPNEWSREQVNSQMRQVHDPRVIATEYDSKSIMKYYFRPWYYKSGKKSSCFSKPNFGLSSRDKALARYLYPEGLAKRKKVEQEIRNRIEEAMASSAAAQGSKSAVMQVMDQYLAPPISENAATEE